MGITNQLSQYARNRMTRRIYRAVPWIGALIALVTVGGAIRRKGFFRGAVDTVLDFTPFIGPVKNMAEAGRGRDFIPDRPARTRER